MDLPCSLSSVINWVVMATIVTVATVVTAIVAIWLQDKRSHFVLGISVVN